MGESSGLSNAMPDAACTPGRTPAHDARSELHESGAFDELVALAAQICGARSALLVQLDPGCAHAPQALACFGLAPEEATHIAALAVAALDGGDAMVRNDFPIDRRHVRTRPTGAATGSNSPGSDPTDAGFFAGIALSDADGRRLGVLAVLDPDRLPVTDRQTTRLRLLARQLAAIITAPGLQRDMQRLTRAVRRIDDEQHAQLTLRSLGDGVVTMDPAGRITFLNELAEHLTGWALADALGRPLTQVVALKDEDGQLRTMPDPSGFPDNPLTGRTSLVRRDGHEISIEGSFAPIITDQRALAGTVLAFRNVTVARKAAAELTHQATHDPLTGLANRRALERRIGGLLETLVAGPAATSGSGHALLYLDLDQFKAVNDSAGHLAGDELLRQLSQVLKQHLRGADLLARLGGDEFGVLLENCDAAHALLVAEKLRQAVEQFVYVWQGSAFAVGISIGLVNIHDASLTLTELLGRADEACYAAKAHGRNRVHVYRPGEHDRAQHHTELEWRDQIKAALRDGRMFLCRQPIVPLDASANSGGGASPRHVEPAHVEPAHVEVLLRMRAASGAIVPPLAFMPAAERYRLTQVLDLWVIESVLRHIVETPADTDVFSINLSRASLLDDNFADFVGAEFSARGVAPARVCFELAEAVAVANPGRAVEVIGKLRRFGCRIAIDGFGSNLSSFALLRQLQVDYLKLDGMLVRGIAGDPVQYAMVESINRVAQLMGMRTIAGSVEDDATLAAVRAIGLDCAQGFAVGRPYDLVPAHAGA